LLEQRVGGPDSRMSCKTQLTGSGENAQAPRCARATWLDDEDRFREVEFARDLLHEIRRQLGNVHEHRQGIASAPMIGEDIERAKFQRHAMSFGSGLMREWTSASFLTRCPRCFSILLNTASTSNPS